MSKKLRGLLVPMLAVAAVCAVPAVAQAEPKWHVNGTLIGPEKINVTEWGTLTMKSPLWGEISCKVLAGAPVWNEGPLATEKEGAWEGLEPFVCHASKLRGKTFISAENAVKLVERVNTKGETVFEAVRGASSLPWPSEPVTVEGKTRMKILGPRGAETGLKFLINAPEETGGPFEVPYEGTLEPRLVNGTKNGLKPSHLEFEGEGGKTGFLKTPDICGGECAMSDLYIKGELLLLGSMQQLVTAE
jgi:hypothetical protein